MTEADPGQAAADPAARDKPLVVLVEDDAVIAELLAFNLQNEGYRTRSFRDGQSLLGTMPGLGAIALFILDIMLPGMDGFEICAQLKRDPNYEWLPVLMLTARSTESDKVRGLEIGADDYLVKPFGMREFLARVQALIRRYSQLEHLRQVRQAPTAASGRPTAGTGTATAFAQPDRLDRAANASGTAGSQELTCGDVVLDDIRHRVFKGGQEIEMTHREYELLKYLMLHRGVAYSRDDLLNHVWGYEYIGETRTVDVHIRQLRRKLEADDANPVLIETVRGRGYRFCEKTAAAGAPE